MNLTEATLKALNGELNEARSHKEDNEKAAPRKDFTRDFGYVKNSPMPGEKELPKRVTVNKWPSSKYDNGCMVGYYDKDELCSYYHSTDNIDDYEYYKSHARQERNKAKEHDEYATELDKKASDVVAKKRAELQNKKDTKMERINLEEATIKALQESRTRGLKFEFISGNPIDVYLDLEDYDNGNTYFGFCDDEHEEIESISVEVDFKLKPNYVCIDTKNLLNIEKFIKKYKLGTPTGEMKQFKSYEYPLYKLDIDRIEDFLLYDDEEDYYEGYDDYED